MSANPKAFCNFAENGHTTLSNFFCNFVDFTLAKYMLEDGGLISHILKTEQIQK